jgi:hypothetical protein
MIHETGFMVQDTGFSGIIMTTRLDLGFLPLLMKGQAEKILKKILKDSEYQITIFHEGDALHEIKT